MNKGDYTNTNNYENEKNKSLPRKVKFNPELKRKGIYLLPNLFTTGALFAGFFAIVQAMESQFALAAMAIFIAMVLDGLDGRVARLTNTQSAFGAEYDSLADMVSFGVAPALLIYEWALHDIGRLGWIVSFIYCVAAALRLARFNTTIGLIDKRFFQGLPSPAAAALVAGLVWVSEISSVEIFAEISWKYSVAWALTLFAGLSMISNVRFYSFKTINLKRSVPFMVIAAIALGFALISVQPQLALFVFFVLYSLSGYIFEIYSLIKHKNNNNNIINNINNNNNNNNNNNS